MVCRVAILSGFARVRRAHSSCCGGGASRGEDDCAAVSVGAREMLGVVGRLWRCVGKDGRGVGTIEGSPDGGQSNGGVLSRHVLAELRSDGNCCHDRVPNIHSFALPSPHTPRPAAAFHLPSRQPDHSISCAIFLWFGSVCIASFSPQVVYIHQGHYHNGLVPPVTNPPSAR